MQLPEELLAGIDLSVLSSKNNPIDALQQKPLKLPSLRIEKEKRSGKVATIISGYADECEAVIELSKKLKQRLAVGGSERDGEILLQGDVREKAA